MKVWSMKMSSVLAGLGVCVLFATTGHAALVHHYTFDNADIVGTKGAGDVIGSADAIPTGAGGGTDITTGQAGVFGEAYAFTQVAATSGNQTDPTLKENLLRAPAGTAPFGTAERTIAVWFQQTASVGQNKMFGYGSTNTDSNGSTSEALDLSLEAGGIRMRMSSGNITYGGGSFDFLGADAGWHHLAVRVNSGATDYNSVDIFVDGVQLSVTAGSSHLNDLMQIPDSPFGMGGVGYDAFLQHGFHGLLDDLRIYDNALTNAEIAQLAVPEPASLALLGMGGVLLLRRR